MSTFKSSYSLIKTYGTSVADPKLGSDGFLTPGSGMGKKSGSGSGMNNPDHISDSLETIVFWSGSGMEKFRSEIRDKHPGSVTLEYSMLLNTTDPYEYAFSGFDDFLTQ